MIVSALATYLKDDKDLKDIVQFYPFISYMEESGSIKNEIMNKYFVMKGTQADNRKLDEIKFVTFFFYICSILIIYFLL